MKEIADSEDKLEKQAKALSDKYRQGTHMITNRAGIMKTFSFSPQQIRVFNASFAHYLLSKQGAHEAYLERHPVADVARRRFTFLRHRLSGMSERVEITKAACAQLKEDVSEAIDESIPDERLTPRSIVNAANFLSTAYLQCKRDKTDFNEKVREKAGFINKRVFGR